MKRAIFFLLLVGCASTERQPIRTVIIRPIPPEELPRTHGEILEVVIEEPPSHSPQTERQSHEPPATKDTAQGPIREDEGQAQRVQSQEVKVPR